MTVNSELTYLSSKTIPKHPKMKIAGFPILQAVRGSDRGEVLVGYVQCVSGNSAASLNAPKVAQYGKAAILGIIGIAIVTYSFFPFKSARSAENLIKGNAGTRPGNES
jgi:hypothetical protein